MKKKEASSLSCGGNRVEIKGKKSGGSSNSALVSSSSVAIDGIKVQQLGELVGFNYSTHKVGYNQPEQVGVQAIDELPLLEHKGVEPQNFTG